MDDVASTAAFLWAEYAQEHDDNLTKFARGLKRRCLAEGTPPLATARAYLAWQNAPVPEPKAA